MNATHTPQMSYDVSGPARADRSYASVLRAKALEGEVERHTNGQDVKLPGRYLLSILQGTLHLFLQQEPQWWLIEAALNHCQSVGKASHEDHASYFHFKLPPTVTIHPLLLDCKGKQALLFSSHSTLLNATIQHLQASPPSL